MKIYKTAALVYDKRKPKVLGYVLIDTIEHEGKFWLVPSWIEKPLEGWKEPEQIILLDSLPHLKVSPDLSIPDSDFVLGYLIPTSELNDQNQIPLPDEAVVINSPDIQIPIPKGIH